MEEMEDFLQKSGWHLKPQAVPGILQHLSEDPTTHAHHPHDALVAHLLDTDLKDVGFPCLPDASSIQRISRLQGPLVLQVVSVRNISQSNSKSVLSTGHEQHGRLLRIRLTDGHTVVSAIEHHSMPGFSLDIAPGTKVNLEKTVSVQNGFLLGDARTFTILGGHVQALYESWEIERKYSGLARMATLKAARAEGDSGPPPFHGLRVAKQEKHDTEKQPSVVRQSQQRGLGMKDNVTRFAAVKDLHEKESLQEKVGSTSGSMSGKDSYKVSYLPVNPGHEPYRHQPMKIPLSDDGFLKARDDVSNDMPESLSSSEASTAGASASHQAESKRDLGDVDVPHEVPEKVKGIDVRVDAIKAAIALGVEAAPLQNRAAAQKLLEKRTNSEFKSGAGGGRGTRGRGRRGGRQEEEATLTLDEWEARRRVPNLLENQVTSTDSDEALARKLHYQLNVESSGLATMRAVSDEAEQIRLNMFSFAGDRSVDEYGGGGRHSGRGRGRGRGRRRGR